MSNVSGPQGPEFQGPQQPYVQNGGFVPPMPPATPPKKRRTGLKVIGGIVGAIVMLVILVNAFGGGGAAPSGTAAVDHTAPNSQPSDLGTCCTGTVDPSTTSTGAVKKPVPKPKPKATKQPASTKPKATQKAEPQYTTAQEEAIESAESYLEMGGFSKKGLIEQLSSNYGEGFDKADAKFAVNHIKVDWNHQAVLSAESYLEMGGMSESALVEQLHSPYGEQFTLAQGQYGAHYAYTHR